MLPSPSQIKAYLPVVESFGFNAALRQATGGQAFPQCVFDHWELMNGNGADPKSKIYETVKAIRVRKGLKEDVPTLDTYYDSELSFSLSFVICAVYDDVWPPFF